MGGNVETIKERLDIVEVLSPYLKIEKTGANYKARCPFHNEKTPSFFISPSRQSFYCFGCGMKGDMFTFVEEMEGLDFRGALKFLADKAGVELESRDGSGSPDRVLRDKLLAVLDAAATFYQAELDQEPSAKEYLVSRGITEESIKHWRLGYAKDDWRNLYAHLVSLGFDQEIILKAGLGKYSPGKETRDPYDVFRGRVMFPLFDAGGKVVAFSGRALAKDVEPASPLDSSGAGGPKYLNTPETVLFTKSELLYGLDKAKDDIRRKNYTILVEGQMDLVLSHQAEVRNAVASSGTAFTEAHLTRLKKMSPRIVLAFDSDEAGYKAAEKSTQLAMELGMEVKIARLPSGSDPADVIKSEPEEWKEILRASQTAIEYFLVDIMAKEPDSRKRNKLIEAKILPLLALLSSAMERSHFVSLIAQRTGMREDVIWEDLRKVKVSTVSHNKQEKENKGDLAVVKKSRTELTQERLEELASWRKEFVDQDVELLDKEEAELKNNLSKELMSEKLGKLIVEISNAEAMKDQASITRLSEEITKVHKDMIALEQKQKSR